MTGNVFVVLGMHKSGTTLVSDILHRSGVPMVEVRSSEGYDQGNKMERDATRMRAGKPFVFSALRHGEGVSEIIEHIENIGGLALAPAGSANAA